MAPAFLDVHDLPARRPHQLVGRDREYALRQPRRRVYQLVAEQRVDLELDHAPVEAVLGDGRLHLLYRRLHRAYSTSSAIRSSASACTAPQISVVMPEL